MITARHSASGWRVSVQPEYYGLLTSADAAPAGSRLLRISNPGLAHFYQFAVRAPDGSERAVLTNVGPSRARRRDPHALGLRVSLTAPPGASRADRRAGSGPAHRERARRRSQSSRLRVAGEPAGAKQFENRGAGLLRLIRVQRDPVE